MLGRLREGAKSPSGLAGSGQLPTAWGAFLRGLCPRESLPSQGEVTSEAKSEGLCPFSVVHTAQFFSIIFG